MRFSEDSKTSAYKWTGSSPSAHEKLSKFAAASDVAWPELLVPIRTCQDYMDRVSAVQGALRQAGVADAPAFGASYGGPCLGCRRLAATGPGGS